MLQIPGGPAVSDFRLAKLLDLLRSREPAVRGLAAHFTHLIDAEPLAGGPLAVLRALLTYGPAHAATPASTGALLLVVPRPGTTSPWSSKATDIAQVCGLAGVRRIERGIEYRVDLATARGEG